jgi:hypothetical protein
MSDAGAASVDGTVLEEQIRACNEIIDTNVDRHEPASENTESDPVLHVRDVYTRVRSHSVQAFDDRFQTSALYSALKFLLRSIADERGYEQRLRYTNNGRKEVSDGIDNGMYWFKLYSSVVLDTQAEIENEWAVRQLKQHRDEDVDHPDNITPLRDGPDPTFVSAIVPLWFALEDILYLWRRTLHMAPDDRAHREALLAGDAAPDGWASPQRYGFVQNLTLPNRGTAAGYITGYQNGEDGKRSRFVVGDTNFFPSVGDVVQFQAEQDEDDEGKAYPTLTVTDTVTLVG